MTARLSLVLLALTLLAAPSSFASDGPTDGGNVLDRMGDTGGLLGERLRDSPSAPEPTSNLDCGGGVMTPGNTPCPPPSAPAVPVDGGLTLLALAGAGYATRKLRARRA